MSENGPASHSVDLIRNEDDTVTAIRITAQAAGQETILGVPMGPRAWIEVLTNVTIRLEQ